MKTNPLSEEEFYCELINRFFHPNSYFFHCINHELEFLLKNVDSSGNEKYLLLGNVIDKLVAADDTTHELAVLRKITAFVDFSDKLSEGVKYLYSNDLDSERMKIEIESLAHSMFNSMLLAFQDDETINELKKILNDTSKDSHEGIQSQPEQLPPEEPESAESEILLESTDTDSKPAKTGEKDAFVGANENVDDASRGGFDIEATEEGSCLNLNNGKSEKSLISQEPASVIQVFRREVRGQLDNLSELSAMTNEEKTRQRCDEVLESISMTSMIYGFDAFEEITSKARKLILDVQKDTDETSCVLLLARETQRILASLLEKDLEKIDKETVKRFAQKLLRFKDSLQNNNESVSDSEKREQKKNEASELVFETDNTRELDFDVEKIKLPGEDDEEIINLIEEISNNSRSMAHASGKDAQLKEEPRILTE